MSEGRLMVWSRLVGAIAVVAVMAVVAVSAMAASSGGARLSVHSSEFGKTLFGPSGTRSLLAIALSLRSS